MSETEKKKPCVMLVTSAGVSKYENTMLITDALCIWVWEEGRGSVSCSGLFHALDQASPYACTQYMQEGKASLATQRAPKLPLITSRLSPGQGKKGIKLFHAESVLHILHDTE